MKTRFLFLTTALLLCLTAVGEVHITIDNPATWSAQKLAPYVGQTVVFDVPMIVCANANGNYVVSPWRKFQPESHGYIGSVEYNETVRVNSSCMFGLSGVSGYHRCGEKIYGLTAYVSSTSSLSWKGGTWHGNTRADLEAGIPDLGDYRLLVCGFNLENYYMTWGSMGADSYSEHQDQRAKISKALKRINADIYGLVELQQGNEAVEEIVNDLNANLSGRNYKYFTDASSGTLQKVEFVYDANKVEPISNKPAETNVEVQNRKKMMCFRELATGERFIYSINHFKAMNTGGADRRKNEAIAVMELYNSYNSNRNVRDKDLLIMGDLNCYAFTEPIKQFTNRGMIDLHRAFHADSSYSYMYSGMASYIDHAFVNPTLYSQITGMSAYHINSDEDDKYTYDKSSDNSMFRCSDHDPVLVGLKLDSTLVYDPSPQINATDIFYGDADELMIQNAYSTDQKSFYAIYSVQGWLVERKEITSDYFTLSLPQEPGMYIVYVYYDGQAYQRRMIVR
ncbi:MAG: hypothetical protein IKQ50_06410 [Paludibacteraceae bacterium]|nr:hypothetical protein [Paludibacteraceae bacterium]